MIYKQSSHDRRESLIKTLIDQSGRSPEDVAALLSRLSAGAIDEAATAWKLADCAFEAKSSFKMTNQQIADWIGRSAVRVGEFVNTVKLFPDAETRSGASFDQANSARKAWFDLDPNAKEGSSPQQVLAEVVASGATARQIRKNRATKARIQNTKAAHLKMQAILTAAPWLNEICFNEDCLELLNRLPDESIRLVFFDPPYFGYKRLGAGTFTTGHEETSGLIAEADGLGREVALELYCSFIEQIAPKLQPQGCVAVFMAATSSSDHEGYVRVLESIRRGGLRIAHELVWLKDKIPPGNFERPFSTQTEKILLLCREDDELIDCFDNADPRYIYKPEGFSLRSNVLKFKTATGEYLANRRAGRVDEDLTHSFEKPVDLSMYLTKKLTYVNDLVWDACGCHGNLALGALRVGRQIIYSESHADRHAEAVRRIHRELKDRQSKCTTEPTEWTEGGNIFDEDESGGGDSAEPDLGDPS